MMTATEHVIDMAALATDCRKALEITLTLLGKYEHRLAPRHKHIIQFTQGRMQKYINWADRIKRGREVLADEHPRHVVRVR